MCGVVSSDPDFADPSQEIAWEYPDLPNGEKQGEADYYCGRVWKALWRHRYAEFKDPKKELQKDLTIDKRVRDEFMHDVEHFRQNK